MSDTKRKQWQMMSEDDRIKWKQERESFTMKGKKQTPKQHLWKIIKY